MSLPRVLYGKVGDKLEFDEEREKGIGKREKWGYGFRRFY